MLGNLFGKKKPAASTTRTPGSTGGRASDPQQTIVTLRESIANQDKRICRQAIDCGNSVSWDFHVCDSGAEFLTLRVFREEHILRKIDQVVAEAKQKLAKGDKKAALFAMKRKKLFEQEVDKIQNVKMTLETQVINLESAAQNAETFKAMAAGSTTMKKIRNDVGIDKVDDMMDSIKEEMELASEINQAIAAPVDPYMADDDELLSELNALEASDLESELLAPPTGQVGLPAVPTNKLPAHKDADADDLKQLEAELAGL